MFGIGTGAGTAADGIACAGGAEVGAGAVTIFGVQGTAVGVGLVGVGSVILIPNNIGHNSTGLSV